MSTKSWHLSRRTILKGFGAAIAVPFLEAMAPNLAWGAPAKASFPTRLGFFYVPNGVNLADWVPAKEGANFELPYTLEPLANVRDALMVCGNLTVDKARPHGDGNGDHARAMAAFLTGKQPVKTEKAKGDEPKVKVGVSADQVAAEKAGQSTKLASLELGCEAGREAGNCDSGYSCAYSSNISWRSEFTPMTKEVNPKLVFERLFAGPVKEETDAARAKRNRYNKSILDFVADDAKSLENKLGSSDNRKLDEYLSGIRDIELRMERASRGPEQAPAGVTKPSGVPKEYEEHIRLLTDLLVLAWQGDLTRVSTFVYANEGSNRNYRFIDVPEGHHDLSHHGKDKDKLAKIRKINHFHVTQFAYFLEKLQGIKEGDGTLLDNCLVMYGSGNGDGDRHNHDDLPVLLVGKGGGVRTGRHVRFARETPICNLYLALLDRMGVQMDSFGDSTGKLDLT
jgi:hypothetical protein